MDGMEVEKVEGVAPSPLTDEQLADLKVREGKELLPTLTDDELTRLMAVNEKNTLTEAASRELARRSDWSEPAIATGDEPIEEDEPAIATGDLAEGDDLVNTSGRPQRLGRDILAPGESLTIEKRHLVDQRLLPRIRHALRLGMLSHGTD